MIFHAVLAQNRTTYKIDTHSTHIHESSPSLLGTGTSIKSVTVKLVLSAHTSFLTEIMLHFLQEDTISINHNWLNGCNIDISWEYIKQGLRDVENEIQDVREEMIKDKTWYQHCQVLTSYVRFVFTSSCLYKGSCLIYVICVCLHTVVSNTYFVVFFVFLRLVYPILPVSLDYPILYCPVYIL